MALRKICREWVQKNNFWPFDDVLQFNSKRDARVFYSPSPDDSTVWDGVILLKVGIDAVDLIYLYVTPARRQSGLGTKLMQFAGEYLRGAHPGMPLLLEVRPSNIGAIKLYEKLGMERLNIRESYYSDGENAQVFRWQL